MTEKERFLSLRLGLSFTVVLSEDSGSFRWVGTFRGFMTEMTVCFVSLQSALLKTKKKRVLRVDLRFMLIWVWCFSTIFKAKSEDILETKILKPPRVLSLVLQSGGFMTSLKSKVKPSWKNDTSLLTKCCGKSRQRPQLSNQPAKSTVRPKTASCWWIMPEGVEWEGRFCNANSFCRLELQMQKKGEKIVKLEGRWT